MAFHVLNQELTKYLLKGEVDQLTDLNEARIRKIKQTACPRCGASLHPRLNERQLFTADDPLPRMLATCECGFELDAQTGIIIDRGSATKVQDPLPIIRPKEE